MLPAHAPFGPVRRPVRRDTGCCCERFTGFDADADAERAIHRAVRHTCCPIHGGGVCPSTSPAGTSA